MQYVGNLKNYSLTLIGMRKGTFISFYFLDLDWILSKLLQIFGSEKLNQSG